MPSSLQWEETEDYGDGVSAERFRDESGQEMILPSDDPIAQRLKKEQQAEQLAQNDYGLSQGLGQAGYQPSAPEPPPEQRMDAPPQYSGPGATGITARPVSATPVMDDGPMPSDLVTVGGPQAGPAEPAGPRSLTSQLEAEGIGPLRRTGPSKGGWQDTSRSFKGNQGATDDLIERSRKNTTNQAKVMQRQAQDMALRQREEKSQRLHDAMRLTVEADTKAAELAEKEMWVTRQMDEHRERRSAVREKKVDEGRIYKEGGKNKILSIVGIALGELAAAQNGGGPNRVLEMVNRMVDQDIQAQRDEIAQAEKGLADMDSEFAMMLKMGKSPSQAAAELKQLQLEDHKNALGMMALDKEMGALQPQLQEAALALDRKQIEDEMKMQKELGVEHSQKYRAGSAGGISLDPRWTKAAKMDKAMGVDSKKARELEILDISGQQVIGDARTKEEAVKLRKSMATAATFDRMLGQMEDAVVNWNSMSIGQRAKAKNLAMNAYGVLKGDDMLGLGVLTGPDLDMMRDMIPDNPNSTVNMGDQERITMQRSISRGQLGDKLGSQGIPQDRIGWSEATYKDSP